MPGIHVRVGRCLRQRRAAISGRDPSIGSTSLDTVTSMHHSIMLHRPGQGRVPHQTLCQHSKGRETLAHLWPGRARHRRRQCPSAAMADADDTGSPLFSIFLLSMLSLALIPYTVYRLCNAAGGEDVVKPWEAVRRLIIAKY